MILDLKIFSVSKSERDKAQELIKQYRACVKQIELRAKALEQMSYSLSDLIEDCSLIRAVAHRILDATKMLDETMENKR